jgi:hypothetical protein
MPKPVRPALRPGGEQRAGPLGNIELQTIAPDPRPAVWIEDGVDVDVWRIRAPGKPFALPPIKDFRVSGQFRQADRMISGAAALDL